MNTEFCYTQQQVDAAAGHPVSVGDRVEGLDWERRVQGRGTKVWWHRRVYESFAKQAVDTVTQLPSDAVTQPHPSEASEVKTAKVAKKYANTRIVGTSLGDKVFVGKYGQNLKVGQIIDYKDNTLVLKRVSSGKLTRVAV